MVKRITTTKKQYLIHYESQNYYYERCDVCATVQLGICLLWITARTLKKSFLHLQLQTSMHTAHCTIHMHLCIYTRRPTTKPSTQFIYFVLLFSHLFLHKHFFPFFALYFIFFPFHQPLTICSCCCSFFSSPFNLHYEVNVYIMLLHVMTNRCEKNI